jgi:uncharacterized protein (UPF0335 family)
MNKDLTTEELEARKEYLTAELKDVNNELMGRQAEKQVIKMKKKTKSKE